MRGLLGGLLPLSLLVAGCGDEDDPNHRTSHDHDGGADAAEFEGCPESTPVFEVGMSTPGRAGRIMAVLRDASDLPPARYFNDWTLAFTDAAGAPLEDVDVVKARAYMRVHDQYGLPDPSVARRAVEPAAFDFKRLNLFMRGPWEVQLSLRSESAGEDDVVVDVCVDE
jgi:hypothetical protein